MAKCHNIKIFAWCESCDDQDDFDDSSHYFDNALFAKKKVEDNDNGDGDYFPHYFDNVCLNCRWRSWGLAPFSSHCPTFSLILTGVGRHDKDL